jgi:nucleotide-binding universal stress UspA family protein
MFKKITVAYNESPEAERALASAIHLARTLSAELRALTIIEPPPAYTAFANAAGSSLPLILNQDRKALYERLQAEARRTANHEGIESQTHLLEGEEVDAIINIGMSYKS